VHVGAADAAEIDGHDRDRHRRGVEADAQQVKQHSGVGAFAQARAIDGDEQQLDDDAVDDETAERRAGIRDVAHVGVERREGWPRIQADAHGPRDDMSVGRRAERGNRLGGNAQNRSGVGIEPRVS